MNNIKKSVLILGSSSDIGIVLAEKFLKNNWFVFCHYFSNKNKLEKLQFKYEKIKLIKMNFNFKNYSSFKTEINKKFNFSINSYVNLIGYVDNKSFNQTTYQSIVKSNNINAVMPLLLLQKLVKTMIKNKFGRIANCSSISVKYGGGLNTFNYALSKHLLEFIPGVYKDWAKQNVLINNIRIGVTDTKMHKKIKNKNMIKRINLIPIKRMAKVEEIVNFLYFLSSNKNTFITGETISISGGE